MSGFLLTWCGAAWPKRIGDGRTERSPVRMSRQVFLKSEARTMSKLSSTLCFLLGIAIATLCTVAPSWAGEWGEEPACVLRCDPRVPLDESGYSCGSDNCTGWFNDCNDGPWTPTAFTGTGTCVAGEMRCNSQAVLFATLARQICACQSDGSTCAFDHYEFRGMQSLTDCANVTCP